MTDECYTLVLSRKGSVFEITRIINLLDGPIIA